MFDNPAFDAHERVVFHEDKESGLRAIIAVHSTRRGPGAGGCHFWHYRSSTEALTDALAEPPYDGLDAAVLDRLIDLLEPIAARLQAAGSR